MRNIIIIFLVLFSFAAKAQEEIPNINNVYYDDIRSVKFHVDGLPLSPPVVILNSSAKLRLSFDDLNIDGEVYDYIYTIEHCNSDWTKSELTDFEYLDGFLENDIDENDFSFQTYQEYIHHWLILPNDDVKWTKSGNYILKVYDDDYDRAPVLSQRFMVIDQKWTVDPSMQLPTNVSKQRTHQELDFKVLFNDKFEVRNPLIEIKATVLQNGRWDNAIHGLKPLFRRQNSLVFDYQDKIVFPSQKEWRHFDTRTLRYLTDRVKRIGEDENDIPTVFLKPDIKRNFQAYLFFNDINGNYVVGQIDNDRPVQNFDLNNSIQINQLKRDLNTTNQEQQLISDYATVYFNLDSPGEIYDHDVYIFGALSDWQLDDRFLMQYDYEEKAYLGNVFLKQGYYNYLYAVVPRDADKNKIEFEEVEGNWFETENEYMILIYYRPLGSRYDQLIGYTHFESNF